MTMVDDVVERRRIRSMASIEGMVLGLLRLCIIMTEIAEK
jgi:hypothetical protein